MAFITAETRSSIVELAMGMLNQAPSTEMLNTLIGKSVDGATTQDLADYIATTAAFTAEYPATQTAREFATEMFGKLITGGTLDAAVNTAVIDLLEGLLTGGTTKAEGFVAVIDFLANPANATHPDLGDIAQSFQNRADAAEYYSITKELGGSTDTDLAAAIASVTSDAATLTAANAAADTSAASDAVVAGETFTLTNSTDINSAVSFYAPRVYTPGGNDRVNSIQDEDSLTGTGDAASLNAILGEPNDAAGSVITPELNNIKTVAVTFAASNTAMTLNLQDSTGVETVDVSRISGGKIATVDDMLATTTAVSVSNTNAQGTAHLLYQDSQLDGAQAVTVTLDDADLAALLVGSTAATPTEGIETLNVVASGTLSSVTSFDNLADNVALTNQNISIAAAVDLTIGGFTDDSEISAITVSGAGDVTLGETGSRTVATQESSVDASELTGSLTVDYQNLDGELDSSVTGGAGDDVIENRDTTTTTWAGDILADVAGGAGDDTIHVDGDLSKPTEIDGDDGDVSVDGGAGDDTIVVAGDVSENAAVTGGAGADTINIGGTINALSGTAAASATDGDVQGTVDAGAGDDTINITHYEVGANAYENSGAAGITGVAGSLVGGDGDDVLNYHSNETATTVATSSALDAARITGIETINLVSKQSIPAADATTINNVQASLVTANDVDSTTADFTFDLGETDATTINMSNEAVVIAATSTGSVTSYNPGDAAAYTLSNVSSSHTLTVSADEGVTNGNARGTMLTAAAYAAAVKADVTADATLNLTLAATASQTTVANAARNDALTVTLNGTGDFAINDDGTGATTSNDIDSLTLVVNGADARTIALGADDFTKALTLSGTQSGALAVTSVEATTITASAIAGDTTITLAAVATDDDKVITMGAGDDSVVASSVTIDRDDTIDFGDGTDSLTVAALASAGDITNSNDEYFENITSLETLNLASGADVVLDDDAQAAGIVTVNVAAASGSTVSVQSDYSNALAMTLGSGGTLTLDNDANVATTIVAAVPAADSTITGTDFGTGGAAITVTAAATATGVVASASAGLDLIITATAGDVTSITVLDSTPATLAAGSNATNTGAITITTDAAWAGAGDTLIVDASDIDDDDADSNADGDVTDNGDRNDNQTVTLDATAATAGDYAVDFRGSAMVDTVTGTAQADTITLGAGADVYNATAGADTITGGAGADTFTYTSIAQSTGGTVDSITDFTTKSDKLDVTFTTANGVNVDLSGFASNRASLADSLSTLDLTAGDHFYATNGSVAFDIDGDGNISDGTDLVVDVTGTVASSDIVLRVTGGTGGITIKGSANADFLTAVGVDTITAGAGADTITLPAAGSVQTVVLTGSASTTVSDSVVNFAHAEDVVNVDLSDIEALGVDLVDLNGLSIGAQTLVQGGALVDLVDGTGDDIIQIAAPYATVALLEAALEDSGASEIVANSAISAGDAMLITFDDGTDSYLGFLTFAEDIANDGTIAAGDASVTVLLEITGAAQNEALSTAAAFVLVA